jgi:hypothetical protein
MSESPSLSRTTSPAAMRAKSPVRIKPLKPIIRRPSGGVLLPEDEEHSQRICAVEKTLEKTVLRIDQVDRSVSALCSKLDSIFSKLNSSNTQSMRDMLGNHHVAKQSDPIYLDDVIDVNVEGGDQGSEPSIDEDDDNNDLDRFLIDDEMFLAIDNANVATLKEHDEEEEAQHLEVHIRNSSDAWRINPKNR